MEFANFEETAHPVSKSMGKGVLSNSAASENSNRASIVCSLVVLIFREMVIMILRSRGETIVPITQ